MMVLPFIASVIAGGIPVDAGRCSRKRRTAWADHGEVIRDVVLPYSRAGVVGGVMLGLGRALGETMAVHPSSATRTASRPPCWRRAPPSRRRSPMNSPKRWAISNVSSLFALGFILFIITFIVLAEAAKLMLMRMERRIG